MNNLIKTLVEQAQDDGDSIHYYSPAFVEKFTRLIVQECVLSCAKVENDSQLVNYGDGDPYSKLAFDCGIRDGALLCQEEIKRHFGVEK